MILKAGRRGRGITALASPTLLPLGNLRMNSHCPRLIAALQHYSITALQHYRVTFQPSAESAQKVSINILYILILKNFNYKLKENEGHLLTD